MPRVHRRAYGLGLCAAIFASAPPGAHAQSVVVGEGRVKTDAGVFVRGGGRTWACLGADWQDEGTAPGSAGQRYSCAGTILDSETYTALSTAKTSLALGDLKSELDLVASNVATTTRSTEAIRKWIEAQARGSNKLLAEAIAARFDALPQRLLANKALKDAIAKLREDVLAAVNAAAEPAPGAGR